VELFGAGQIKVWEGILQDAPRTSGDILAMEPAAVGYQSTLSDDESVLCIPIDADMTAWGEPSAQRRTAFPSSQINQNGSAQLLPAGDPSGGDMPAISHAWATIDNHLDGANPDIAESAYGNQDIELGRIFLDFLSIKGIGAESGWENIVLAGADG